MLEQVLELIFVARDHCAIASGEVGVDRPKFWGLVVLHERVGFVAGRDRVLELLAHREHAGGAQLDLGNFGLATALDLSRGAPLLLEVNRLIPLPHDERAAQALPYRFVVLRIGEEALGDLLQLRIVRILILLKEVVRLGPIVSFLILGGLIFRPPLLLKQLKGALKIKVEDRLKLLLSKNQIGMTFPEVHLIGDGRPERFPVLLADG
jgi:hypothetical protein